MFIRAFFKTKKKKKLYFIQLVNKNEISKRYTIKEKLCFLFINKLE